MLIDIDLRQSADVDPEFAGIIQHLRKPGIQAVDSFDHKDIILP